MKKENDLIHVPDIAIFQVEDIKSFHYDPDYADTVLTYNDGSTLRLRGNVLYLILMALQGVN